VVLEPNCSYAVTPLFGTRRGHAAQAVEAVRATEGIKYVQFQVFDKAPQRTPERVGGCHLQDLSPGSPGAITPIDEVSMSWWLSGAVQEYLDRQLCHPSNKLAWQKLFNWFKRNP
jgi:hypothetical protein